MILRHPEWLTLLPVLLLAGWMLPRLGLWRPLRIALLVLITLFAPSGLAGLLSRGWARLGAAPKEPGP